MFFRNSRRKTLKAFEKCCQIWQKKVRDRERDLGTFTENPLYQNIEKNENPEQPFGVRGVGEVPICPPLGAISNAIKDALGIRLNDLPMKPSVILKALSKK